MNFLGASLRVVSTINVIRHDRHHLAFIVAMIGQVCTAIGQPFFLYSPTKLSASWFSEQQRAIATMFASMGESLCIMLFTYLYNCVIFFYFSKSHWYLDNYYIFH